MTDILIYWRDYRHNIGANAAHSGIWAWNSNAKAVGELVAGDQMWLVTSGKSLRLEPPEAGFLVAVWHVSYAGDNPDDNIAYPADQFRYRAWAEEAKSRVLPEAVYVDDILRPDGKDESISIGRFIQGPRRLRREVVEKLASRAALS